MKILIFVLCLMIFTINSYLYIFVSSLERNHYPTETQSIFYLINIVLLFLVVQTNKKYK